MFLDLFYEMKAARLPVSVREYLTLLEAMDARVPEYSINDFYFLARASLVKDEKFLDRFDQVFGKVFKGLEPTLPMEEAVDIPAEWLKKLAERFLTEEEKKLVESLGGWDKLMEEFKKRLEEQKKRHEGGNKWIGTAGTSPFGAYGYNPEGIRIGQDGNRNFSAVKVWDKREFRNLDTDVEIGTRSIKVALRRLRRWAREGAAEELDLDGTISETARHGYLDIQMR
ncbi:MAG: VWA domain-containing protein, partial [Alphaproteobacteria bacterium]|nr:VWA domain-containing protein [Alphaproteobacteria bacterium]MDX5367925.1 VWA domain-containing protein [Alphaproteobacteria bacterium]MDX5462778.1 VWA domain-containing protein [Alphaproteobacteria bacterium]